MASRFLIFILLIIGCNNHPNKNALCHLGNVMKGNNIEFIGYKNLKFKKLEFLDINYKKIKMLKNPKFVEDVKGNKSIEVNDTILNLLQNDCYLIINDKIKFKISEIETENIERHGNWGSAGYECILSKYRLNDSLITNQQYIKVFK